jgi:hypothetical protein
MTDAAALHHAVDSFGTEMRITKKGGSINERQRANVLWWR